MWPSEVLWKTFWSRTCCVTAWDRNFCQVWRIMWRNSESETFGYNLRKISDNWMYCTTEWMYDILFSGIKINILWIICLTDKYKIQNKTEIQNCKHLVIYIIIKILFYEQNFWFKLATKKWTKTKFKHYTVKMKRYYPVPLITP